MIYSELVAAMTTPRPLFDERSAGEVLRDLYELNAVRIEPLPAERDRNFRVEGEDGRSFVLKFSNSAESEEVSRFQNGALEHIRRVDPDLPVPRLHSTRKGSSLARVEAADGRRHAVRLMSWLNGVTLGESSLSARVTDAMGACLARLDVALADYAHPSPSQPLLWDMSHAGELRRFLKHIGDPHLRTRCEAVLDTFANELQPRAAALRQQVIFNDMHADNVLVDPEDRARLAGIIDFGDVVHAPLVYDVAIAVSYLLGEGTELLKYASCFVRAYHARMPLAEEELTLLPDLVATRMVSTVLIGNWRATRHPDNRDYILRSEPAATRRLDRLASLGAREFSHRLLAACGY